MTNMKIKVGFFYFNIINILIEFVTYIGVWKRINKSNVIFFAYVKYIKRCCSIENREISNCFFPDKVNSDRGIDLLVYNTSDIYLLILL